MLLPVYLNDEMPERVSWTRCKVWLYFLYSPSQPHRGDQAGSAHTVKAQAMLWTVKDDIFLGVLSV